MSQPRILILGSGTPTGGGSGPRMLVNNVNAGILNAEIAGIVTHYPEGGVAMLGKESNLPTYVMDGFPVRKAGGEFSDSQIATIRKLYTEMLNHFGGIDSIDFILLSGWMKYVLGLPANKTANIHPSRVDGSFGGQGKYGDFAHQHAFEAYQRGEIVETAITMHFVTERFDDPSVVIAQQPIRLDGCKSWEDAKARVVGPTEHTFQLAVTKALIEGQVWLENGSVVWNTDFQFSSPEYLKGAAF